MQSEHNINSCVFWVLVACIHVHTVVTLVLMSGQYIDTTKTCPLWNSCVAK